MRLHKFHLINMTPPVTRDAEKSILQPVSVWETDDDQKVHIISGPTVNPL